MYLKNDNITIFDFIKAVSLKYLPVQYNVSDNKFKKMYIELYFNKFISFKLNNK